jgi:hypothetical protein
MKDLERWKPHDLKANRQDSLCLFHLTYSGPYLIYRQFRLGFPARAIFMVKADGGKTDKKAFSKEKRIMQDAGP